MEKFEMIFNNWQNGQISVAQKQLKALKKVELLDYISYCIECFGSDKAANTISNIRKLID
jgi:hypothetical protein